MNDLSSKTAIVGAASRGLGCGIAMALAEAGAQVIVVSRTPAAFLEAANDGTIQSGTIQQAPANAGGMMGGAWPGASSPRGRDYPTGITR